MGVFSMDTWAEDFIQRNRREREGHPCHLQEEVRALPNKTTLFSCFLDTNPHQWLLKTIPPHVAPDTTSTRHTQPHPFGKTTHLSKERKHHRDHMVEVLIRSWGCSMRQGMAPRPPSRPLRCQLCHMG